MNLETVYRSFNEAEAQLVRSRLEAAGIEVYITHDVVGTSGMGSTVTTGGVLVQVPEAKADEAKALLASTG